MKSAIVLACAALALSGCMAPAEQDRRARDVVEAMGFRDITMTGYVGWSACGDDTYCRGFEADSPAGARVSGVVGSDDYKGWTVRITGVAKASYVGSAITAPIPSAPQ